MPPATFFYERNDAVEELSTGPESVFESRTRFLIFAASVGYARNRYVENPGDDGEMRWSYIGQNQRLSVITAALTYAHTEDDDAIFNAEKQIEVLTSYAAGGARIIQKEVVDEPGDNLDNLINFLQRYRDEDGPKDRIGILEEIENEVSSLRPSESG